VYKKSAGYTNSVHSRVELTFPDYRDGQVIQSDTHYKYSRKVKRTTAEVIGSSKKLDLALLKASSLPTGAKALKVATKSPTPGSRVHSVGHPDGGLWTYTQGVVRAIRYTIVQSKLGQHQFNAVITQSPYNKGDSGGPMINDRGEVVAVVQSYNPRNRLQSTAIDARELKSFLKHYSRNENPADALDHYNRAVLLFDRQQHSDSIREVDKALGGGLEAKSVPKAWRLRALCQLELRRYSSAITDARKSIEAAEKFINAPVPKAEGASESSKKLAEVLARLEKLQVKLDAADAYKLVGKIYQKRALAHGRSSDWQSSIDAYTNALRYQKKSETSYKNRGWAHEKLKNYRSAIADYTQAIALDSKDSFSYLGRGTCHHWLRDYASAARDYRRTMALTSSSSSRYRTAFNNLRKLQTR